MIEKHAITHFHIKHVSSNIFFTKRRPYRIPLVQISPTNKPYQKNNLLLLIPHLSYEHEIIALKCRC